MAVRDSDRKLLSIQDEMDENIAEWGRAKTALASVHASAEKMTSEFVMLRDVIQERKSEFVIQQASLRDQVSGALSLL